MTNIDLKFLIKFLNDYYSFSEDQIMVADDHMRIITEMMIYTHIWESKPNLKKLYRLSGLVNQEKYVWDSSNIVPDYSKRDFIKGIREKFDKKGNQIGEFIRERVSFFFKECLCSFRIFFLYDRRL